MRVAWILRLGRAIAILGASSICPLMAFGDELSEQETATYIINALETRISEHNSDFRVAQVAAEIDPEHLSIAYTIVFSSGNSKVKRKYLELQKVERVRAGRNNITLECDSDCATTWDRGKVIYRGPAQLIQYIDGEKNALRLARALKHYSTITRRTHPPDPFDSRR